MNMKQKRDNQKQTGCFRLSLLYSDTILIVFYFTLMFFEVFGVSGNNTESIKYAPCYLLPTTV